MPNFLKRWYGIVICIGLGLLVWLETMSIHASRYSEINAVLPEEFVFLEDIAPSIQQNIRYASSDNFIGSPIDGYLAPSCMLTKPTARELAKIQMEVQKYGLSLLVYDCYRPQRAVDHFVRWSHDISDQINKLAYYPQVDKRDFFLLGYIMQRSGHSRGSTVDLTLLNLQTGQPLDMGTPFDFMDPLSHPASRQVTQEQYQNRQLLRRFMFKHGFVGIATEWWHFTLKDEPYKHTYFNFPVVAKSAMRQEVN